MKKTNMDKELALLSQCVDYIETLIGRQPDDVFEGISEAIGVEIYGDLTLPKWKVACKASFQ